jgi:hypothetical protein
MFEQLTTQVFPFVAKILKPLRHGMQLCDLRSALVKECLKTITHTAQSAKHAFEPLALTILPCVLKTVISSIGPISISARKCLDQTIRASSCPASFLPLFCEGITNEHPKYRESSVEFLLLCLTLAEESSSREHNIVVEKAIVKTLADRTATVRHTAVKAFEVMKGKWPDRTQK